MTKKIAVSLPENLYERLERLRKSQRLSRSAALQRAVGRWLSDEERERAVEEYLQSYREVPESVETAAAWTAAEAWGEWKEH